MTVREGGGIGGVVVLEVLHVGSGHCGGSVDRWIGGLDRMGNRVVLAEAAERMAGGAEICCRRTCGFKPGQRRGFMRLKMSVTYRGSLQRLVGAGIVGKDDTTAARQPGSPAARQPGSLGGTAT
ncbi:hypothetical protein DHEL01_v209384 [Diaporthe helianthi]|uniref:Uncharacterized protein n=1 Tax=Diaporthe helianthi TaxID=158607 RepID=A0A2P5HPM4_DIAHE|nr:hypothetical protein DHEL01_v209384 [Diaporthe helianthi]